MHKIVVEYRGGRGAREEVGKEENRVGGGVDDAWGRREEGWMTGGGGCLI